MFLDLGEAHHGERDSLEPPILGVPMEFQWTLERSSFQGPRARTALPIS